MTQALDTRPARRRKIGLLARVCATLIRPRPPQDRASVAAAVRLLIEERRMLRLDLEGVGAQVASGDRIEDVLAVSRAARREIVQIERALMRLGVRMSELA